MAIVKLKCKDQQVTELFEMFKLPYAVAPRPTPVPQPVGGSASTSAINSVEATRLHAYNELRKWTRLSTK